MNPRKKMVIGITGSVGSGKTTVSMILCKNGFRIIDADKIGHDIIRKNPTAYKRIVSQFGKRVLDKKKNIDRKKLGNIVFKNKKKLAKLNQITHPEILKEINNQILRSKCRNIAIDAPLLFESKMERMFDKIVLVKASEKNIFLRNKKFSKQKLKTVLKAQAPVKGKIKKADFVIDNDGSINDLEDKVLKILNNL